MNERRLNERWNVRRSLNMHRSFCPHRKKGNWNSMFKRIGLLVLANLAVFIMLSVILTVVQMVFGVNFGTMAGSSLNLSTLFIFSMIVGLQRLDHLAADEQADGKDEHGRADDRHEQSATRSWRAYPRRRRAPRGRRAGFRCPKSASMKANPMPLPLVPPHQAPWLPSRRGFSTS